MQPYPAPPPQGLPPQRPRKPGRAVGLGVLVAVIADLVAITLLPTGLGLAPASQGSPAPTLPNAAGPSTALPSRPGPSTAPSVTPGNAEVSVSPQVQRGLALIRVTSPGQSGAGTGMVLTPDGQVLTNYHVVRSTSLVRVTIAATGKRYDAKLVGRDATRDVALLQLQGASGLEPVTIDHHPVAVGDTVVAAGNASGQGYITAFSGKITATDQSIRVRGQSEYDPEENLRGLIETDAHAEPGDSGGPMFDDTFEVMGMTTAGSTRGEASSYAVPISEAMSVVDQVRRGDESGTVVIGPKPYLGIIAERAESSAGVPVNSVESGSAAAGAGVETGAHITELDGRPVRSHAELSAVLDSLQPGDKVTLKWTTRGGERRTAEITLGTSSLN
ncbi:S1C family serine protease [Nigerium massiliense]|uniref:S1C family serine protease n=1 Tax=Nigerium massiliense TaxID=1522317 RepID=UPI000694DDA2|nr:trypsin-like peptidase domain-containing protein [Nigerium massiliense]